MEVNYSVICFITLAAGPNFIKLFTSIIYKCLKKAVVNVRGRPFQPTLMFVCNVRSLPQSGAPESCFTWVGSSLNWKGLSGTNTCQITNTEVTGSDKHSRLPRVENACQYDLCISTVFSSKGFIMLVKIFLTSQISLKFSQEDPIFVSALNNVMGLAVDWVGNNLVTIS